MEFVYQTLVKLGYTHPLHPVLTHVVLGMVIGCFLFAALAKAVRNPGLSQTARHCSILALVMLLPTALLGLMDWQHFYSGGMLLPIKMKIMLAFLLLLLLILAHVFNRKQKIVSNGVFFLYTICLLAAVGLGYFGGELVYGSKSPKEELLKGSTASGAAIFQQNCSGCHFSDSTADKIGPGLKGIFKQPKFPASGRPATEENFKSVLVKPLDAMPPFRHLTQEEVSDLIAYLKTL